MRSIRHPALLASALAALLLAIVVGIAPISYATGADATDRLRHDAIEALKVERELTGQAEQSRREPPLALREKIKAADDKGAALLADLLADGFPASQNLLDTLGHLPQPGATGVRQSPHPTRQMYDDAIRELGGDPGPPPVRTVSDGSWTGGMAALAAAVAVLSAIAAVTVVIVIRRHKDKRLVALAMTDSLTALHNRRRLDDDLVACSTKQAQPVGVLMVDVDNFKLVNDLQGHAAGDRVLQHVGALLAVHVRPNDVAYRYGGEEFCVLLPDATEADAFGVAERIRQATSALRIPGLDPVTVSVGVAIGTGANVAQTLERADAAMYGAKRDGRDRVAVASSVVGSGATHG